MVMVPENLTLHERLQIAGQTAPALRDARRKRPINVVDADGNVLRTIDSVELAKKVHERAGIEFDVQDGERPRLRTCEDCGRAVRVPSKGPVPKRCQDHSGFPCAGYRGDPCPNRKVSPARSVIKNGEWRCPTCTRKSQWDTRGRNEADRTCPGCGKPRGKGSVPGSKCIKCAAKGRSPRMSPEKRRAAGIAGAKARLALPPERLAEAYRKMAEKRRKPCVGCHVCAKPVSASTARAARRTGRDVFCGEHLGESHRQARLRSEAAKREKRQR